MNKYPLAGARSAPDGTTTFRLWAPFRKEVALVLPDQTLPMKAVAEGYWELTVTDIYPGARYLYLLDGALQRPDPASRWQPEGVHGPSAIPDETFVFTDQHWKGLAATELIIYEIHTGTFSAPGTFSGIREKLDYLKELGITAIELMPVAQFPGERNWGYDGVYPFAVQNSYGTPDDLKMLVNAAHALGIAVILDVVYNHQGPEGNYFYDYGPYFTGRYKTPWGDAINFDEPWCDGVRGFYLQNALMWLEEFHIDGLRLDAVHAFSDNSAIHFTQELSVAVKELEARTGMRKLLIGEIDLNNPRFIDPVEAGGYGLDAQWADEFHHALHSRLTGEQQGYYEDFGSIEHLRHAFENAYVYTGEYSVHRKRRFGRKPVNNPFHQFVVFAQNHDQIGNRMMGERLSVLLSFEALKLAAATVLLSPFIPLLFMGEEYGEKNPFLFFTSHGDADLIKAVREGRQQEFAHTGEAPDPQDTHTFAQSKLSWQTAEGHHAALLRYYKELLLLRKNTPALLNTAREATRVHHTNSEDLLVLERSKDAAALLIVFNAGITSHELSYTTYGKLRLLFDSAALAFNGPGTNTAVADDQPLMISPLSAVVYEIIAYEN
ncbi:malto-oligosyltrehalose trehalohydrolase [Chitinophaga arvensicola]|uniref:Malto-oligosyltrehalose trehalohydrolase n=1 Tax=Chitinophaga arvensicola TaxID=29529 RepID=A0A1I0RRS7_9BACT|nr:malto-oligosyltrehalose trehalohydrolase [Chitinophaga arvensicola]SEW44050.1 maltooligosyl trehalose hydrolase [Chitinophaga arvensicola]